MNDKLRPIFHFSPREGYMNDPNGLIYNRKTKEYHLFYQYSKTMYFDEYFGSWAEKNWGHAVSKNLIDWEEREIALPHDQIGLIWSGSSAADRNNDFGVFPPGSDEDDRLVCAYACANAEPVKDYGKICCCLAYSADGGDTWQKYENNPVIPNTRNQYGEAFGDPKLFWLEDDFYPAGGTWVMITVLKMRVFTSPDLKNWTFQSEGVLENQPFYSECPDIFPYVIGGQKKWVYSGAGKYYIVGDFRHREDGALCFVAESKKLEANCGNLYATQHFNNLPDGRILQLSWMSDHSSLDLYEEGKVWDGVQSIPTEFSLKQENGEYVLVFNPARELAAMREDAALQVENYSFEGALPQAEGVRLSVFDLEAVFDVSQARAFTLEFRKGGRETTRIFYTKEKSEVEVNTYLSGKVVHEHRHMPVKTENGRLKLRLLADTTVFDLFVNGGAASHGTLFFPAAESQGIALTAEGVLKIDKLAVYPIRTKKQAEGKM